MQLGRIHKPGQDLSPLTSVRTKNFAHRNFFHISRLLLIVFGARTSRVVLSLGESEDETDRERGRVVNGSAMHDGSGRRRGGAEEESVW